MATKRELDAMLDNLKSGNKPKKTEEKKPEKADKATIDALINTINNEKKEKAAAAENAKEKAENSNNKVRTDSPNETTRVFDKKPVSEYERKFGKKIKPIPDTPIERPVYPSDEEPSPIKKKKMKIVISGELPDYEAIRQKELEKDKAAKSSAESSPDNEKQRIAEEMAAEKKRIAEQKAAEEKRIAEEKKAAEEKRIAEQKAAEEKRIEKEKSKEKKRAAEEAKLAEKKRLADEMAAEKQRIADEKAAAEKKAAEKKRRIAEAKARIAEEEARLEAEEAESIAEAAEETVNEDFTEITETDEASEISEPSETSEPAVKTIADDEPTEEDKAADELDEAIEALSNAALNYTESFDDDEDFAPKKRNAPKQAPKKKVGLFGKIKNMLSGDVFDEDEQYKFSQMNPPENKNVNKTDFTEVEDEDEDLPLETEHDDLFEQTDDSESAELIDAAMAAINDEPSPSDFREVESAGSEPAEEVNSEPDDIELEAELDEVMSEAEEAAAETEDVPETEVFSLSDEDETVQEETEFEIEDEEYDETPEISEETSENSDKVTSALEDILDEDPEEILSATTERTSKGKKKNTFKLKKSRKKFAALGVVCAVFAVIGIVSVIAAAVNGIRNIGSADNKKSEFTHIVYPAAIMDISAFNNPTELTSEQVITATLWSVIMDKNKIGKYESQLGDTVSIPDVDVEKYAVELFGEGIPAFEHCTVGPVEARFYYSNGAYNVKLKPITFTYAPDVRSIEKNGDKYTLTVDYIDELPEWMPKSVAKTVEYTLTEKDDGSYTIDSMRVISVKSSNL